MALRRLSSEKGFNLIEVTVASAILGIIALGISSIFIFGMNQLGGSRSKRSKAQAISNIVSSLRDNVTLYQTNWDPSNTSTETILSKPLPWAWSGISILPASACPECPGRLGFVIQPHPDEGMRGIYLVTVRLTHSELITGHEDVTFLVGSK